MGTCIDFIGANMDESPDLVGNFSGFQKDTSTVNCIILTFQAEQNEKLGPNYRDNDDHNFQSWFKVSFRKSLHFDENHCGYFLSAGLLCFAIVGGYADCHYAYSGVLYST